MKVKIKVKVFEEVCKPVISGNGDWIDLRASKDIVINAPQAGTQYTKDNNKYRDVDVPTVIIPLGVAMMLPKGYEAILASRSSTPSKFGLSIPNGFGVIDNSYCGDKDEWKYVATPMRKTTILKGDRICQFRVQLSQKATFWQKIKWLFTSGVEFEFVDKLNNPNRGGIGSTGIR